MRQPTAAFAAACALVAVSLGAVRAAATTGAGHDRIAPPPIPAPRNVVVNDPYADPQPEQQWEVAHARSGATGTIVSAWTDFADLSEGRVGYGRSTNGGRTWSDLGMLPPGPEGCPWGDPGVAAHDATGTVYVSTVGVVPVCGTWTLHVLVSTSTDDGRQFTAPVDVTPGAVADKPLLSVDNSGGPHDGSVYVVWFGSTRDGEPGTAIGFARKPPGGEFERGGDLTVLDGPIPFGAFPIVAPDGDLFVFWQRTDEPPYLVEFVRSDDGGETFSEPATVAERITNEPRFSGYGNPKAAVDASGGPHHGRLYVAFEDDVGGPGGWDVYLTWSDDDGATWSAPIRVNDDVGAATDDHPDVAVNDDGVVEVSWYDRREDPADTAAHVMAAYSYDGGATFRTNQKITDLPTPGIPSGSGVPAPLGHYKWASADGSEFVHTWTDNRDLGDGVDDNIFSARARPRCEDVESTLGEIGRPVLPASGGTLEVTASFENHTDEVQTVRRQYTYRSADDDITWAGGPEELTLPPHSSRIEAASLVVDSSLPATSYELTLGVLDGPGRYECADSLVFDKSPDEW